ADAADHRVHDFYVALGAGSQDRAQLGLENLRVGEAEANRAEPELRIDLGRGGLFAVELVAAEVERADDDRVWLHLPRNLEVLLVLDLFRREFLALHVKELRAKQPDAF